MIIVTKNSYDHYNDDRYVSRSLSLPKKPIIVDMKGDYSLNDGYRCEETHCIASNK